ncbi:alpha/beta hydrolase [Streptomyces sp. NPDC002730]|uniref:alpha/beta hydrolase n=1 Tax=Streptomyces sp. NPDC002730 TaxID=3364662 RepID=UPI0036A69E74
MTTYRTKALVLALSATAVATGLTASAAPVAYAGTSAAAGTSPVPALSWRSCAKTDGPAGQECAVLPVPVDYRDPSGPQLDLAVSRIRSDRPEARRGVLLVIPGGPGSSGVRRLTDKGKALVGEMDGAYDLVSLDPRGVGGSTKAGCGLDEDDRRLGTLRAWPKPGGDITENVARARRTAEACDRNGGEALRSFSTANQVRDIDRLRQALGEEKLSAWGASYGAYVGSVYAQKYPRHTDRWVLDSSGDPDPERVGQGWLENMSRAAHERFPDFADWAANPPAEYENLRLAGRSEEVLPLVLALAAKLDREPKETHTAGVPLTGNMLRLAVQSALYSNGSFPRLAQLIQAAGHPEGKPVLPDDLAYPLPDSDASLTVAVICNDVRWRGTAASYARAVAADRARYPLTAGMPANITPCTFWKSAPADKPTRITSRGPSNILMIQGLRDPATPYFGALKMRRALGDRTRLVTVGQGGHGAYLGNGNACGDRKVTEFLTTGERPEQDTHCAN